MSQLIDVILQHLKGLGHGRKEFLFDGVLVAAVLVHGDSHGPLMNPPVHISVNDKIHIAVIADGQNPDIVLVVAITDLIFVAAAEREDLDCLLGGLVIGPQVSVDHICNMASIRARFRPDFTVIHDPQHNTLAGKQIALSGKNLVGISLKIHQINALAVPLHGEIIFHLVELVDSVFRGPRQLVIQADSTHNSV